MKNMFIAIGIVLFLPVMVLAAQPTGTTFDDWTVTDGVISTNTSGCFDDYVCSGEVKGDGFIQRMITDISGNSFFHTVITGETDSLAPSVLPFRDENFVPVGNASGGISDQMTLQESSPDIGNFKTTSILNTGYACVDGCESVKITQSVWTDFDPATSFIPAASPDPQIDTPSTAKERLVTDFTYLQRIGTDGETIVGQSTELYQFVGLTAWQNGLDDPDTVGINEGSTVDVDYQVFAFANAKGYYADGTGVVTLTDNTGWDNQNAGDMKWIPYVTGAGLDSVNVSAIWIGQQLTNTANGGSGIGQDFSYEGYRNLTVDSDGNPDTGNAVALDDKTSVFSLINTDVESWTTDPFGTVPEMVAPPQ